MSATVSSKLISLMTAVSDCINLQNWHALKTTVSHRNLLFLAESYFVRHTSKLESKISASQSQQHTILCITKLNHMANSNVSWFFRGCGGGEAGSTGFWPQAIHHLRELMTQRLNPTASCQSSVTSLALLLTQQAEVATMELQMFLLMWDGRAQAPKYTFDSERQPSKKFGMWLGHIAKLFFSSRGI